MVIEKLDEEIIKFISEHPNCETLDLRKHLAGKVHVRTLRMHLKDLVAVGQVEIRLSMKDTRKVLYRIKGDVNVRSYVVSPVETMQTF